MSTINFSNVEKRMKAAIEALHREFSSIRTGRANPDMLTSLKVRAYDSSMQLDQLASVSLSDHRTLSVKVWDASLVENVEKAIRESSLGLNPASSEGVTIIVPIPPLMQSRRQEFVKLAGKYTEQSRVSVRNARRDAIEEIRAQQKEGEFSEDEMHEGIGKIQKLTDSTINDINKSLEKKEQDIVNL